MTHLSTILLGILLGVGGFPFLQAATVEADKEGELRALCEKYASAYREKNASAIAGLFAGRNIVLMPPNESAAVGPEAIKDRYQAYFEKSGSKLKGAESLEVGGDVRDWARLGDLLAITASNSKYKYIVVLVHAQDDGWKIARLIWNTNQ